MADSFSKKENNKKKSKKLQDKQLRREERKDNNNKGKTLDDMIVYVDVNGHFTEVPPHLQNREADLAKAKKAQEDTTIDPDADFTGIVTYLSDKGYGFITEEKTGENIFFHVGQTTQTVEKHNKVTYKKEMTPKGYRAIDIRK
ncbi:Cold shock protein, CspA family [Paenimyroides ummariense]|uniref:Cold shock protein, CspA family n=1 Tax=Paenimyroides ummariense TaxID=913024 RepID=A0A1I5CF98_9FLAO|nr:cold shock domain-containing protein [Paenimyroides ummariense]SFN85680.1 Cold shock protein, CspA family [Paenimyroides ummariense]